jgi:hypothetical protein
VWYAFSMPPRCRVTFFDNHHQLRRTLEVEAALPYAAAEIALRKLIESNIPIENLGPAVKVDVVTTT